MIATWTIEQSDQMNNRKKGLKSIFYKKNYQNNHFKRLSALKKRKKREAIPMEITFFLADFY